MVNSSRKSTPPETRSSQRASISDAASIMLRCPAMSAHGVSADLLICTRHGADKEALKAGDLVVCELRGRELDGATAAVRLADRS